MEIEYENTKKDVSPFKIEIYRLIFEKILYKYNIKLRY